jgi:hypothetical protein
MVPAKEAQTPALPLDLYRCLVGLLALGYFGWLHSEWALYSSPEGYLDHEKIRKIFWFTRINLYQPWMGDWGRYALFLSGWAACLGVFTGWNSRRCAFWAWLVGTCHLRWNFPVANLNDTSVLFPLFWCALLPTGKTLQLWRGRQDWQAWTQTVVPGGVAKVFVVNLALAYWVTGLSKWTSMYWKKGIALYCALQLNVARTQGMWGVEYLPFLQLMNYAALLVECSLPLVFFLRVNHPLRWIGFVLALGLHGGIMLTIGIEYANALWILSWLIVLREDIAERLGWLRSQLLVGMRAATRYAATVVLIIALSMSEGVPGLGDAYGLGFALQWSLGLSQEYHLFDWIDRFNYVVRHRATLDGKPVESPFPPGLRGFLLMSYLYDMRWMRLPRGEMGEWQRSIKQRLAARSAARLQNGNYVLEGEVTRITPDNLDLHRWSQVTMLECRFENGKVVTSL